MERQGVGFAEIGGSRGLSVSHTFRGASKLGIKVGEALRGRVKCGKEQPFIFDGNWPHATIHFTATRFAILVYAGKVTECVDATFANELSSSGFRPKKAKNTRRAYKTTRADE